MAESGAPPEPVLEVPPPQEIKVLETADDIQVRTREGLALTASGQLFAESTT
jgi:hypothetical protein